MSEYDILQSALCNWILAWVVHHYIIHCKQADSCFDLDPGILTRFSFWYLSSCWILAFSGVTKPWGAEHALSADTVNVRALVVYFHARYRKNLLAPTVLQNIAARTTEIPRVQQKLSAVSLQWLHSWEVLGVSDKFSSDPLSSLRDGVDLGCDDFPCIRSCSDLGREMAPKYVNSDRLSFDGPSVQRLTLFSVA